jgi:hypothetical protein
MTAGDTLERGLRCLLSWLVAAVILDACEAAAGARAGAALTVTGWWSPLRWRDGRRAPPLERTGAVEWHAV